MNRDDILKMITGHCAGVASTKENGLVATKVYIDDLADELVKLNLPVVNCQREQLKEKYTPEFEDWIQYQQKDIKFDKYILNDTYLSKEQMFEYWESDKQNL